MGVESDLEINPSSLRRRRQIRSVWTRSLVTPRRERRRWKVWAPVKGAGWQQQQGVVWQEAVRVAIALSSTNEIASRLGSCQKGRSRSICSSDCTVIYWHL